MLGWRSCLRQQALRQFAHRLGARECREDPSSDTVPSLRSSETALGRQTCDDGVT